MRILLAISVVALVALLWATISIGRHIRRSRQRTRFLRERQSKMEQADSPPIHVSASPAISAIAPPPVFFPFAQPAQVATALPIDSQEWPPKKLPQSAEAVAATAPDVQPDSFLRRPVRSVHSPHPAPPFALPLPRPDWVYFNKDMGDLSDPLPSRMRDRARSR